MEHPREEEESLDRDRIAALVQALSSKLEVNYAKSVRLSLEGDIYIELSTAEVPRMVQGKFRNSLTVCMVRPLSGGQELRILQTIRLNMANSNVERIQLGLIDDKGAYVMPTEEFNDLEDQTTYILSVLENFVKNDSSIEVKWEVLSKSNTPAHSKELLSQPSATAKWFGGPRGEELSS